MKIAIVQFPGSNCERETILAVSRAGMVPIEFLWNEATSKLREMDGYIIVGGFSYEDRSRAGIIAALDPVMNEIKVQSELGKPVLGICNGAQILVETGLVPGLKDNQLGMTLTENKRIADGKILGTGFYNTWIHMRPCDNDRPNAFTRYLTKESVLSVPIAHAEGRFMMPDALLQELQQDGLTVFQYCDESGRIIDNFPINPNGSMFNIAAVVNKAGNVMAMMPHPERTSDGDAIFQSMRDYILDKKQFSPTKLNYTPNPESNTAYVRNPLAQELIVSLIITDNYAATVQNTLKQLGIPVRVSRMVHWEIDSTNEELIERIKKTGILYNERKEFLVSKDELHNSSAKSYLVRAKEDLLGQQKLQMLQDHFSISDLNTIHHGILWIFTSEDGSIQHLKDSILDTHIISNPYAHEVYEYA